MKKAAVAGLQLLGAVVFSGLCISLAFSKIGLSKVWVVWFTAFLYGYLCYLSRAFWRRKLYWVLLMGCVFAHVAILLAVQRAYPDLSLFYYVFVGSVEGAVVYWLVLAAMD